ncbi:nuclear transport factor 2 family protein [Streptomyces platensis]|uniref:nuclear transport factor 2 family protein n=1 Tax=Streptomyces platensis TaxID=58346 RepID=UPI00331A36C7
MTAKNAATDAVQSIADKVEITEKTAEFGLRVDTHEWDRLKALLADAVTIDYSLLHGKDPVTTDPDGVVDMWHTVLENLTSTQHLIAGQVITVDGDIATCVANLVASHYLPNESGDPTWTIGGRYEFGLVRTESGWRINAVVLIPKWSTGNRTIMQIAGSRNQTN